MAKLDELTIEVATKLTVVDLVTDGNANKRKWLCKCECGGVKITS